MQLPSADVLANTVHERLVDGLHSVVEPGSGDGAGATFRAVDAARGLAASTTFATDASFEAIARGGADTERALADAAGWADPAADSSRARV